MNLIRFKVNHSRIFLSFSHLLYEMDGIFHQVFHETWTLALRIWGMDLICSAGLMARSPAKLSGGTLIPPTLMHSSLRQPPTSATRPASVTWRQLQHWSLHRRHPIQKFAIPTWDSASGAPSATRPAPRLGRSNLDFHPKTKSSKKHRANVTREFICTLSVFLLIRT